MVRGEEEVEGGEEAADEEIPEDEEEIEAEEDLGEARAPVFSLYLPLRVEDETLGVVALGNRVDGQPFADEDGRLAESLCTHLALALDHAALFAERTKRIDQLSVLLQISREITSTLDLEKVLTTM